MHRHELTDAQWKRLQPLLWLTPGPPSKLGDRNFIDAVLWRAKTGAPWRDLPSRFGPFKTVFNRFSRWAARGVWERVFKELRVDVDDIGTLIDATVVRAHQDASGGKGGSDAMLWATLEAVFPRKSTPPRTRKVSRSKSR